MYLAIARMTATTPQKPAWAGDDLLSKVVNRLIQTKPLYALMKRQARQVLIKTAEQNGIPWRQTRADYEASAIAQQLEAIHNPAVIYPDYYQVPFHAYDAGNLCWQAAFEAESATYAMALRVWPDETLTWQAAQDRLRDSFHQVLADYLTQPVHDALDVGCSVGISTQTLHRFFAAAIARCPHHGPRPIALHADGSSSPRSPPRDHPLASRPGRSHGPAIRLV